MKLDDTVCRGSLIIHKGVSYVVVNPCGTYSTNSLGRKWVPGWLITPTVSAEAGIVVDRQKIPFDEEVEMFFPGAVFPLSEFII